MNRLAQCPHCNGQVMAHTEGDAVIGYERVARCLQCGREPAPSQPLPLVQGREPGYQASSRDRQTVAW